MNDRAFERFVPWQQISVAWRQLDLHLLLDSAIELAEAERHFCRHHLVGLTSEDLILLTLHVAKLTKRADIVTRLSHIAESVGAAHLVEEVEAGLKEIEKDSSPDFAVRYESVIEKLVSDETMIANDQSAITTAAKALELDRLSYFHATEFAAADLKDITYVDFDGPEGQFSVRGSDNLGVRCRNNPYQVRRFRFHVSGRWSYAPNKWFNYQGDPDFQAPDYSAGNNYWLPGANVASLLAWGGRVATIQTLEDKQMEVQLNPGASVMFIMNDNSVRPGGFRDNAGQLDVRWTEIDPIYP